MSVSGVDADADADADDGEGEAAERGVSWLAATPPGTSLLVAGPPMTHKRRLLLRLLAGVDADAVRGLVTTRLDADGIAEEYRAIHPAVPEDRLAVVDCVTDQRTDFSPERRDTDTRRYVSDPGDLTGIGIGISEFMRDADERGLEFAVGLHTLSTTLMYADLQRVYRFVHVLTSRTRAAGFRGAYVLDEPADDPGMIAQPFDGLVAVRDGDEGPEVRVRGVDAGPSRWTPLSSV